MSLDDNTLYSSISNFTSNAETISWNRFIAFLTGNSLLILSWVMLVNLLTNYLIRYFISLPICVFGFLLSIAFTFLGFRGRRFLKSFVDTGNELENNCFLSGDYKDKEKWAFHKIIAVREKGFTKIFGSFYLLIISPLLFAILFLMFFVVTLLYN